MPVACGWEGGCPGGQEHDIHLTLNVGPRLKPNYQTLSEPRYAYMTSPMPPLRLLCLCHDFQALLHFAALGSNLFFSIHLGC